MISINKVEKQLKKMDNVDHVWIKPNGSLVFHTVGGAMGCMHEDIYNNPDDFDEVTDVYHDWISGADDKHHTAAIIAESANDFYNS